MVNSALRICFFIVALFSINIADVLAASNTKVVCATSKGAFVVRTKCKKGETQAVAKTFLATVRQGPIGIQGAAGNIGSTGSAGTKGTVGDLGARGSLDLESCRKVSGSDSNIFDPSDGQNVATVSCNSNTEFLLTYSFNSNSAFSFGGSSTNPNLRAVVQASLAVGNNIPTGVELTAERIVTSSPYVLTVTAVCCPRNT